MGGGTTTLRDGLGTAGIIVTKEQWRWHSGIALVHARASAGGDRKHMDAARSLRTWPMVAVDEELEAL